MTQDQPPSPDLPDQAPEGVSDTPSEISEPLPEPTEPLLELSEPFSESVEVPSEPFGTPLEPSETLPEISEPLSEVVGTPSEPSETLLETSEALPQTIESSSEPAETLSEPLLSEPLLSEPLLSEVIPSESALSEETLSEAALSKETLSEEILSEAALAEKTLAEPFDDFTPSETAQTAEVPPPSSEVPQVVEQPISQTLQEYWERARPVIKTQTIRVLRVTIQGLEGAVSRLEAEPRQELPSPSDPLATPGSAASESKTSGSVASESIESDKSGSSFSVDKWWQKVRPAWEQFQVWWAKLLTWVRSRLPATWNEKLSDRALSGAIAGILVILLWITSGVFSTKPKPTPVAIAPSPKVTAPVPKPPTSPQVKAREPAKPTLPKPAEEKPVAQKPAVRVNPSPIPKPSPPPPPLKLTPEQTLIARIQDQVAEISNQYLNGLIQSVQANFRSSQLTVKVGTGWYGLSQLQQNKLANEMLGRAKELDFSKLEITDPEGALLARSPVVGPDMIILKRQSESQEAADSTS